MISSSQRPLPDNTLHSQHDNDLAGPKHVAVSQRQFALIAGEMCPVGTQRKMTNSTYCNKHFKRVGVTVKDQVFTVLYQAARYRGIWRSESLLAFHLYIYMFIKICVQFSMGVKIQLFEVGAYRPYTFRFLSVGMDEKRSLKRKSKHKRRIGRSHYE